VTEIVEFRGKKLPFDEDGYLEDPTVWDEEVAKFIAERLGIGEKFEKYKDEYLKVLYYMRDYFSKFNIGPPYAMILKKCKMTNERFYELFPRGPAEDAIKLAGLPKAAAAGC